MQSVMLHYAMPVVLVREVGRRGRGEGSGGASGPAQVSVGVETGVQSELASVGG